MGESLTYSRQCIGEGRVYHSQVGMSVMHAKCMIAERKLSDQRGRIFRELEVKDLILRQSAVCVCA